MGRGGSVGKGGIPIAYCLLPLAYCLLPFAFCLLPTPYSLLPVPYSLFPFLLILLQTPPIVYF
ncbi:MAG: hypothetical protein F6J90_31290 [Moorea sp. SIOASIH]|uniref:hypothetical protein n=1 Tax=Moorena sp. SIOASIH TaxID=2607817 RepID=UPI0013BAE1A0|nr:hypothetical protein [Moorena sp. SIOASIH]NEO40576.1 hypothetical protein [Moorena sp. SIOASIH]